VGVVYKTIEGIEFVKVGAVLGFLVVALVAAVSGDAYGDLPKTVTDAGWASGLEVSLVLGALAFAGVGGANNLCQSNGIRDKGLGMGAHIPRVVSPITGEDQARPSTGYMVRQDEENIARFWGWWRVAKKEQFYFFYLTGLAAIVVFSLIAYSTVYGQDIGEDLDFIQGEARCSGTWSAPGSARCSGSSAPSRCSQGCWGSSTTSPASAATRSRPSTRGRARGSPRAGSTSASCGCSWPRAARCC
jgi:hypothetical protein